MSRVLYVGGGYIGCSGANALAKAGHRVTLVDTSPAVVDAINRHECPVPLLGPTMADGIDAVREIPPRWTDRYEAAFIAVPTEKNGEPYTAAVMQVVLNLQQHAQEERPVIIESTLPIGTMRTLAARITAFPLGIAPRRDWFGEANAGIADAVRWLGFPPGPHAETARSLVRAQSPRLRYLGDVAVVEASKSIENALLYAPVVLAMDYARSYPELDMVQVLEIVGTHFARPTYHMQAGVGGYCVPIAPSYGRTFLGEQLRRTEADIRRAAFRGTLPPTQKAALLLGWGYKAGFPIPQGSPSRDYARWLTERGVRVYVMDPVCDAVGQTPWTQEDGAEALTWHGEPCDTVYLMTPHPPFLNPEFVREVLQQTRAPYVVDTCGGWESHQAKSIPVGVHYVRLWRAGWEEPWSA